MAFASSARRKPVHVGFAPGQFIQNLASVDQDTVLGAIATIGSRWVREVMVWAEIEPTTQGVFDWTKWDAMVTKCNTFGQHLVPVIGGSPDWARPLQPGTPILPPDSPTTLAAFCTAAVNRYKASIKHWEVWNEPNNTLFWGKTPDAMEYTALLVAAYNAIKAADPAAYVITGGLSPAPSGSIADPPIYLDAMFANGAGTHCDYVGHHPYSYPIPASLSSTYGFGAWYQIADSSPSLLSVMQSHGAVKPLWLTEVGAPTYGEGAGATRANNYGVDIYPPTPQWVDEDVQSDIWNDAITLARQSGGISGAVFLYNILDTAAPGVDTDREKHFGAYRSDLSPKPAVATFTAAVNATGGPA